MSSIQILVSKEFLRLKVLLSLIYLILEAYYHFFISDDFGYMGYVQDFNLFKYILAKTVFVAMLFQSYNMYQHSKFLYTSFLLLLFFFFIPNSILFAYSNTGYGAFFSNIFFVSLFSLTPYLKFSFPPLKISQKKKTITMIVLPLVLMIPVFLTFKYEINLKVLLLKEVYETRDVFSEKMLGYLTYIYHIEIKTIIPLALVFFMIKKKYILVVVLTLALIYLYVISGNKIVYFTTFIFVFFYYLGSSFTSKISNFFIVTIALLLIAPIIDNLFFSTPILQGTFVNRFLFIPSLLTQWYFEFFDGNSFYFAESHFFNQFIKSPYDMPVGYLLTKIYWGEPAVFANNGVVSDGFMNLGYLGVVLFSVIFSLLFSLFNSFNMNKGYFGVFFTYIYLMLSVPFLSSFITGGIFIFIVIVLFLLRENKEDSIAVT